MQKQPNSYHCVICGVRNDASLKVRFYDTVDDNGRPELLARFTAGEDYRKRAVKVSDSGRIRNELQTLCSEALEFIGDSRIRLHLDQVDDSVLPLETKKQIAEILHWYKKTHPIWFGWLEFAG